MKSAKKVCAVFVVLGCVLAPAGLAQVSYPPPIEWQQSFGGDSTDVLNDLRQTADGGYILGGTSASRPSGNKTSPSFGQYDYWAIRLDAQGNKLWEQTFGGIGDEVWPHGMDVLESVQQTADGGFVLGGFSYSPPDGNKTSPRYGAMDFWLVRLDAQGHKLWDRSFGGTGEDFLSCLQQTTDGGFILGGDSDSPVSGTKTSPKFGGRDFWVVRLDANGQQVWDISFGGLPNGLLADDSVSCLQQTADGGFVLGGSSPSLPGGTKTGLNYGGTDFWLVRLDADGNVLWDQTYGGIYGDYLESLQQTADGGFILGGHSQSPAGGSKTSPSFGLVDFWVVRTDANGSPLWDRSFGGSGWDYLESVSQTPEGGFVLGGPSDSLPSGNKTSPNYHSATDWVPGFDDYWVVRLDANGDKLWDQSFGGSHSDDLGCLRPTADGGFILGGDSTSASGGNKTSPNWGNEDIWVLKLASDQDRDGDGVADPQDRCPDTPAGASVDANGCSAEQRDTDGDGVNDALDLCADTPPGSVVDAAGCSLEQLCPCAGPWKNHGEYVNRVKEVAAQFEQAGLITAAQAQEFLRRATRSDCGKQCR